MSEIHTTQQLMTRQQVQAYRALKVPAPARVDLYDRQHPVVADEGRTLAEAVDALVDLMRAARRFARVWGGGR